jgi:hypothetical protein
MLSVLRLYNIVDGMINEYRAFGGMRLGSRNQNTHTKPARLPLCPPQISHDLTWVQTLATTGGKL